MATHRSGGTSKSKRSVGHGRYTVRRRKGEGEDEEGRSGKAGIGRHAGKNRPPAARQGGLAVQETIRRRPGKVRPRAAQEYIQPKSRLPRRDSLGRFILGKPVRTAGSAARKKKVPVREIKKPAVPKRGKPAKPSKVLKKPAKKPVRKPVKKPVKKPVRKPAKKPVRKPAKKPVRKLVKVRKKPAKKPPKKIPKRLPRRRRRRRKPRGPVPPLPVAAGEADLVMQQKLQEVMDLVTMMFPEASTSIKTAINADWTVDGELRLDGLPEELRTEEGMLEIVALVSEAFRAFHPFDQVPPMGGKFWLSFGVRFGPNNESQAKELADLYKRFRGMFQVGTYPAFAWSLGAIQDAIAPGGLRTIFEGVARKVGIPPSTLLIRFIWLPGPKRLWRELTRSQQYTQRPGHYDHEGGKEKLK